MPLSEYEQHVLDQMELRLASDDPLLARTLRMRVRRSRARRVVVVTGWVTGLCLLVAGAAMFQIWLALTGIVLMYAVTALAVPGLVDGARLQGVLAGRLIWSARRDQRRAARRDFKARLEQRWDGGRP